MIALKDFEALVAELQEFDRLAKKSSLAAPAGAPSPN
jgi:hypothetical protein